MFCFWTEREEYQNVPVLSAVPIVILMQNNQHVFEVYFGVPFLVSSTSIIHSFFGPCLTYL